MVLERLDSILKRYRPKTFPPAPLDLTFQWISIMGKEMFTPVNIFLKRNLRNDKVTCNEEEGLSVGLKICLSRVCHCAAW